MPRSGTTLLRNLLGNHQRIAVSPELQFFTLIYPRWRKFTPLDQAANREALIRAIFRKLDKFDRVSDYLDITGQTGKSPRDVLVEKRTQFQERTAGREATVSNYFKVLVELFSHREAPVYLVKTPTNLRMVPAIRHHLPGAQFLWIHRDPRDVVTSMVHGKQSYTKDVKKVASLYRHLNQLGLAHEQALGQQRWFLVPFEQLVRSPEPVLAGILDFMNLEHQPGMLNDVSVVNSSFGEGRGLDSSVIGRYRERLSPRTIDVIETITGITMRRMGYQPLSKSSLGPVRKLFYRAYGRAFCWKEEFKGFFKHRGRFHWIEPFFDV